MQGHLRNEEHVQQSVQNTHVQRDQENNQLSKQKLEWSHEEDPHPLSHWSYVDVAFALVFIIARPFPHLGCTFGQDGWRVCFWNSECDQAVYEARQDQLDPIQPPPPCPLGKIASDEWANRGTDERSCAESCHRNATFFCFPEIGQGTANKNHGARESDTIDASADQKCSDVLRDSARDDKDYCDQKCTRIDGFPAKCFAERSCSGLSANINM